MADLIEIKGLAEFQRSLREVNPILAKKLEDELTAIAEKVAVDARKRVPSNSGRARSSLVAGSGPEGPLVVGGGERAPYYGWLDFGRRLPRYGGSRRDGPWLRTGKGPTDGRYIFPAVEANRDEILTAASDAFAKAWFEANSL